MDNSRKSNTTNDSLEIFLNTHATTILQFCARTRGLKGVMATPLQDFTQEVQRVLIEKIEQGEAPFDVDLELVDEAAFKEVLKPAVDRVVEAEKKKLSPRKKLHFSFDVSRADTAASLENPTKGFETEEILELIATILSPEKMEDVLAWMLGMKKGLNRAEVSHLAAKYNCSEENIMKLNKNELPGTVTKRAERICKRIKNLLEERVGMKAAAVFLAAGAALGLGTNAAAQEVDQATSSAIQDRYVQCFDPESLEDRSYVQEELSSEDRNYVQGELLFEYVQRSRAISAADRYVQ